MSFDVLAYGGGPVFDIVIGELASSAPTPPGPTIDALAQGSIAYKWVAAIEGCPYLLTDATPQQALDAWAAEPDWQLALSGLYVEVELDQRLDPWEPFQPNSGGKLTLRIADDGNDTFGTFANNRMGHETPITATVDRTDTTIPAKDTTPFDASGDAWIGTECFGYAGKTSGSFTGVTRGKYSPFKTASGGRYTHHHRVFDDTNSVRIEAQVSSKPTRWDGRWVGLWMHRIANDVLNTKADARLVFAGKVAGLAEDPQGLTTNIDVEHVLAHYAESAIGRDMWSGTVEPGIYLGVDWTFTASDFNGTTLRLANPLTVVSGVPASVNEIQAGLRSIEEICVAINDWLDAERTAARLWGTYSMGVVGDEAPRMRLRGNTSGGSNLSFSLVGLPVAVAVLFGYEGLELSNNGKHSVIKYTGPVSGTWTVDGSQAPAHSLFKLTDNGFPWFDQGFTLATQRGTLVDNYGYFPNEIKSQITTQGSDPWGVFMADDKALFVGQLVGNTITSIRSFAFEYLMVGETTAFDGYARLGAEIQTVKLRQIAMLQMSVADFLNRSATSTGSAGFNSPHDVFAYGFGVELPAELWDETAADLLGATADDTLIAVIDKPTKLADVLGGDARFAVAFPRWKDEAIGWARWSTPSSAVVDLTEENKAKPAGSKEDHRTALLESSHWARQIVKIQYNRDITAPTSSDGFLSSVTFEDAAAIDDNSGVAKTVQLQLRNTYSQVSQGGEAVLDSLPQFLAMHPLFSRPVRLLTRSITPQLFETLSVGDNVYVSDSFARNPEDGRRGLSSYPAIVVAHHWAPGGHTTPQESESGDPASPMGGDITVMLLPADRSPEYAPSAQVDAAAANGGYNAGTLTLTTEAHRFSHSTEVVDSSRFAPGDKVTITETDPVDPANPLTWDRTIATGGVGTNALTLTVALSSPAWDATKTYRITYDSYADASSTQRQLAYQADETSGRVSSTAAPDLYSGGQMNVLPNSFDFLDQTDPVELPANLHYADGAPRDVGTDVALCHLVNQFIDFKSAAKVGMATNGESAISLGPGTAWISQQTFPRFLGTETLTGWLSRTVSVALRFRSTNGATASMKVRISTRPPVGNDAVGPYVERVFTTTSTTMVISAAVEMSLALKAAGFFDSGLIWVQVLGQGNNFVYGGMPVFSESRRKLV